jgi:hypothetical protein
MIFKKIVDDPALIVYRIVNPTKEIKSKYPKNIIICFDYEHIWNVNHLIGIPEHPCYIFTYLKVIPFRNSMSFKSYKTLPLGLDDYINSDNNFALLLLQTGENVSPAFNKEIIIRGNYDKLMKLSKTNFRKKLERILNDSLPKNLTLLSWMETVLLMQRFTDLNLPNYPDVVSVKNISAPVTFDNISIFYDLHATNHIDEVAFIRYIEENSENLNDSIVIYNTYNNILPKIIEQFESKNIKFKRLSDDSISTQCKNIFALNMTYQLTDELS